MNVVPFIKPDEKIDYLQRQGFEVKRIQHTNYVNCYHNQIEEEHVEVYAVYQNGQEFRKPGYSHYGLREWSWVDSVFESIIQEKFKAWMLHGIGINT